MHPSPLPGGLVMLSGKVYVHFVEAKRSIIKAEFTTDFVISCGARNRNHFYHTKKQYEMRFLFFPREKVLTLGNASVHFIEAKRSVLEMTFEAKRTRGLRHHPRRATPWRGVGGRFPPPWGVFRRKRYSRRQNPPQRRVGGFHWIPTDV